MLWRSLFAGALVLAVGVPAMGLAVGPALAAPEKRVALVLGNARYGAAGEVATVRANAAAMAAALRKAGFTVTRADDLGRVALESALERFRESLAGADLGFVYYSGLAVGVEEREYLLPVDAAPAMAGDLSREALDLDGVLGDLREAGRKTVVALDPAGANPLAGRVGGGALGTPLEADGLFVIYAHRPGVPPVAATGKGPDAFTAALAREIVKPGVPLRDSLAEVARSVATRSGGQQLPWLQDRLGGDLVLVPAVVATAKPVPKEPAVKETPAKEATKEAAVPAPPPAVASLPPGRYEAVRGGMLFERPAVGARGVAPLAQGDAVTVIEAVPQGSWVRVRDASGRVGYVTAGSLSERWGEPPPPVAALPRGAIESGPSSEPSAGPGEITALPPSGASDPQGADGPAVTAEQRAMQALGSARTAAERARGGRGGHWSYQFPNGDRYEGAWSQREGNGGLGRPSREGFGVYRFANGQTYEGEWMRDLMSGYGVMTFLDGSRFAGRFRDGQPDGPGVFRFGDGSQSAGLWRGPVKLDD
ncbi:caspase family protein [Azospirillum doebereinerae]